MVIKETRSDKIFNFINYFLLACVFLICLYPLWFIIIASISNPDPVSYTHLSATAAASVKVSASPNSSTPANAGTSMLAEK